MKLRHLVFGAAISILTLAALPVAAQTPSARSVGYNGFSFSYDSSLGTHVDIDELAADTNGQDAQRTQFTVSSADTTPSLFDAGLGVQVYNTADFANLPNQTAQLQKLQSLLGAKTDLNTFMTTTNTTAPESALPFIPVAAAGQTIRARAQYVTTPAVTGVSYITVYKEDVSPFLGNEFFYTFQGLSTDGSHYVSAVMKLNTSLFPASAPADFNATTFQAGLDQYMQQSLTTLNSAQQTDFTPSLGIFDAVVQSFNFAPSTSAIQPTVPPVANTDPTLGGLTKSNWVLATYGTAEAPIAVLPDAPINLIFTQDGISGSAGCNTYFGQFHYDTNALSFSDIGTTQKSCADNVMTQETDYLKALQTSTSYVIDNGVLKITYQEGVLTFNPNGAPVPQVTVTPVIGGNANLGGLAGVNWVLSSFGPASAPVAALPGTSVTAVFTQDGISGSAGCNSYSGNFTYSNGTLAFTPFITTKIACTDANVQNQENTYLTALQSATAYQIVNNQLQVTYPDGILTFNPDNSVTATPVLSLTTTPVVNTDPTLGGLANVHWVLVSLGPTAAPIAALPDAPVNIDFTQQGVTGNSGCNDYSGTFVYNNSSLTFSPLVSTQKACAENLMTQEAVYLQALQGASGFQIVNGQLQITYPDGVLVFQAAT